MTTPTMPIGDHSTEVPDELVDEFNTWNDLDTKVAVLIGEVADAKETAERAAAADVEAIAQAALNGTKEPKPTELQARADVAALERRLAGLTAARDQRRKEFDDAVLKHRRRWRREAVETLAQAQDDLRNVIEVWRSVRSRRDDAAALVGWLDEVWVDAHNPAGQFPSDAVGAVIGQLQQPRRAHRSDLGDAALHVTADSGVEAWLEADAATLGVSEVDPEELMEGLMTPDPDVDAA